MLVGAGEGRGERKESKINKYNIVILQRSG